MARLQMELRRPIEEHQIEGYKNLEILVEPGEVADLLHLLLALRYELATRIDFIGTKRSADVRIELGSSGEPTVIARIDRTRWHLKVPEHEIDYICRFLTEFVLGSARVDHVDLQGGPESRCDAMIRVLGPYDTVDETEARRRLGLSRDQSID